MSRENVTDRNKMLSHPYFISCEDSVLTTCAKTSPTVDLSSNMVNDVHKQPGKFDKLQLWMIDDKLTIFIAIRQNCTLFELYTNLGKWHPSLRWFSTVNVFIINLLTARKTIIQLGQIK